MCLGVVGAPSFTGAVIVNVLQGQIIFCSAGSPEALQTRGPILLPLKGRKAVLFASGGVR